MCAVMKKTLKILLCFIICFSVLLSMISCDFVGLSKLIRNIVISKINGPSRPEGYTGGFPMESHFVSSHEFCWFETYDELMEALNRTRAYGTKIPITPYFDCEEEYGVDIKFCVVIPWKYTKDLDEGKDCFDQYISEDSLSIDAFVFFDEVSIDELIFSTYSSYSSLHLIQYTATDNFTPPAESDSVNIYPIDDYKLRYAVAYGETVKFHFRCNLFRDKIDNYMDMLKSSIAVIK